MPSSSAIQQSLSSLLPTHAAKLPAPLVHLCESLLAQSRQRASHLKTEEEIARAYACCEIACNRLRVKCRLPAVKAGGAPCKPAVYKKLVAFLERVLDEDGIATTPKSTPGGKKRAADGTLKRTAVEVDSVTPSKSIARNEFLGKIKTSAKRKSEAENDGEAPSYTMPSIRKLCKTFSTPLLAPHVYTGTCIVLKLSGLWPPDEDGPAPDDDSFRETVAGLLTALYIMTLTRMQTAKMTTRVYKFTCARAVEVLEYQPGAKGVEEWIRRINREGYCRGQDWWGSVPEKVFHFDSNAEGAEETGDEEGSVGRGYEEDEDEEEDPILSGRRRRRRTTADPAQGRTGERETELEDDDDDPEDVLLPGLATMMQDFMDLLSGERTRAYETWKKHFLLKLDKLDQMPTSKPKSKLGTKAGKSSVGLVS